MPTENSKHRGHSLTKAMKCINEQFKIACTLPSTSTENQTIKSVRP
jgi:hypothetical protein